jgi:hypothetical protein
MDLPTNIFLTTQIKKQSKAKIIALANDKKDAKKFYSAGMDYVLVPNILTSEKVNAIIHDLNKGKKFELNWIWGRAALFQASLPLATITSAGRSVRSLRR